MSMPGPWANQGDALKRDGTANDVALIDLGGEGGDRTYTYAAFDRQCAATARGLLKRGLKRGDKVAIISANRAEFLFAFFGAMRAGLVAVPVNWKLPPATVAYILEDCGAKLVLGDGARLGLCPKSLPRVTFGKDFDALLDPGPFAAVAMQADEPAMFLYTSGSTGRPKGVVLSHWSHLWVVVTRARPAGQPTLRQLVAAPLYHMNALSTCQVAFGQGDSIILLPSFTVASYADAAARHRATVLTSVPTMIAMLLKEPDRVAAIDRDAVQIVRMGSAPLSQTLIDQVRRAFPKAQISNGYGTTEAGPVVFGPHPEGKPHPEVSLGCAHPLVELRLVADGKVAERQGVLEMKCAALMTGYHNLPEVTAKAMTPDGFYRTGDVFRRDEDGFFYFVGRADDMFVSGGENIYPGEVEKMLERHPGIHQAAVLPIADELKGAKPVAFIVARPGAALDEDAVKRYALANAPAYQHPRRVWFLPEMPLAGTNKIDRKALAGLAEQSTKEHA
jgi:acyl-CoA synthetase (AMP-forming)/AMP-acid ligase II